MSKLLRYFAPGQFVFVTAATANRRPLLVKNVRLLGRAVLRSKTGCQFDVIAWAVLPDHFHAIIFSPSGETSKILRKVKVSFAMQLQKRQDHIGKVWQHRFWDHVLRSERDLARHVNYIHFNPVKHGLSNSQNDWLLSSYRRYVKSGFYEIGCGQKEIESDKIEVGE